MPDWRVLYPGRFLQKETLAAPKVIRIVRVEHDQLEGEKGIETKTIVHYKAADGDGQIVWCKTNAALTEFALDEPDYGKWIGRLITIHHDPNVMLGKQKVGGTRVCGSPEMKAPKRVEIKRPRRKKGDMYELYPTDNKGARKVTSQAEPPPPPPLDEPELPMPEREAGMEG